MPPPKKPLIFVYSGIGFTGWVFLALFQLFWEKNKIKFLRGMAKNGI
jgi:hypothetical protein